ALSWLCQAASAVCPGLGATPRISDWRQRYHVQTREGLLSNASTVARSSAENRSHSPVWASGNVGTPDSAQMPAPLSTATREAAATSSAPSSVIRSDSSRMSPPYLGPGGCGLAQSLGSALRTCGCTGTSRSERRPPPAL